MVELNKYYSFLMALMLALSGATWTLKYDSDPTSFLVAGFLLFWLLIVPLRTGLNFLEKADVALREKKRFPGGLLLPLGMVFLLVIAIVTIYFGVKEIKTVKETTNKSVDLTTLLSRSVQRHGDAPAVVGHLRRSTEK